MLRGAWIFETFACPELVNELAVTEGVDNWAVAVWKLPGGNDSCTKHAATIPEECENNTSPTEPPT
jgi:hypothetical protein